MTDSSLPMPAGLADGLGQEGALLAEARYTPIAWSPAQSNCRPIWRQREHIQLLGSRSPDAFAHIKRITVCP